MRLYFKFGYDFGRMYVGVRLGDERMDDLVGYGYDTAPVLRSLTLRLLFFSVAVGNLSV
jgi:hypothetical protein